VLTDTITIEPRYCGPPVSGNGGWTAGSVAAHLPGVVEVTLRLPPPLNTRLAIATAEDGRVTATGPGGVVAEARTVAPIADFVVPDVSLEQAVRADDRSAPAFVHHPFPTCFVCGPDRAPDDGLCLFPGPVPETEGVVASPWTPHRSLAGPDGALDRRSVWAALDCPGWLAHTAAGRPRVRGVFAVLGRFAVEIHETPVIGQDYVVLGCTGEPDGRKLPAHTAVVDPAAGSVLAVGRSLWIEADPRAFT
jgi:hypothetical protein